MTEPVTNAELEAQRRKVKALLREADRATKGRDHGGGWNRKSQSEHVRDGTYRRDRHGPLTDGVLDWREKPTGEPPASVKSQRRWVRNVADQHAWDHGCRFDERRGEHIADFFRTYLRHSKGEWAGQPFEMTDWQRREVIFPLFGWVKEDERGRWCRRFRRSYAEIPKKNYKSTTASGIGLYMLCGDGEEGSQVYSLGADKDQARIVHAEAVNMVDASPDLAEALKVNRSSNTISYPATNSSYRALSAAGRGKAGFNIHCAIADELHEWFGSELWEAIKYGYRARREPLQFVITNAGDDLQSICYKQREKAQAILDGTIFDDSFFALICAATREEAEAEVATVREGATELPVAERCNPGLGHVIRKADLLADINDAIQTPSELPNLLRLTYGVWEVGSKPWLNMTQWEKCGADYGEEDLLGQSCWLGLDLSQTRDMTALVAMFKQEDGEYRQLVWFWLPEETIREEKKVMDYAGWVRDGHLISIPGATIEYSWIEDFIASDLAPRFDVCGVVYDAMYAHDLVQRLELDHVLLPVKFPQTFPAFAGPTSTFERLVIQGKLRHNRHPILTWQAGHVAVKSDNNNNKRPIKPPDGDHRKIDGIVASIMALSQATGLEVGSMYDSPDKELVVI